MIATLALLLAVADQPQTVSLRVSGDGETTPCMANIAGPVVDLRDAAAFDNALAPYPSKDWLIDFAVDENVAYRCIGGVIYRVQLAGYQLTKMGYVQSYGREKLRGRAN